MKKGWRVVLIIALVAILLGTVSVGVGLMTGGDVSRVLDVLDERYHPTMYIKYVGEVINTFREAMQFFLFYYFYLSHSLLPLPRVP